jgi:hypothetical protein
MSGMLRRTLTQRLLKRGISTETKVQSAGQRFSTLMSELKTTPKDFDKLKRDVFAAAFSEHRLPWVNLLSDYEALYDASWQLEVDLNRLENENKALQPSKLMMKARKMKEEFEDEACTDMQSVVDLYCEFLKFPTTQTGIQTLIKKRCLKDGKLTDDAKEVLNELESDVEGDFVIKSLEYLMLPDSKAAQCTKDFDDGGFVCAGDLRLGTGLVLTMAQREIKAEGLDDPEFDITFCDDSAEEMKTIIDGEVKDFDA